LQLVAPSWHMLEIMHVVLLGTPESDQAPFIRARISGRPSKKMLIERYESFQGPFTDTDTDDAAVQVFSQYSTLHLHP